MAWREASDEGGGRQDGTTRDGLSKEVTIKHKDGRTKRWPRAKQDQGPPRPKEQPPKKEERSRGQVLKGSHVPAACLVKGRRVRSWEAGRQRPG